MCARLVSSTAASATVENEASGRPFKREGFMDDWQLSIRGYGIPCTGFIPWNDGLFLFYAFVVLCESPTSGKKDKLEIYHGEEISCVWFETYKIVREREMQREYKMSFFLLHTNLFLYRRKILIWLSRKWKVLSLRKEE